MVHCPESLTHQLGFSTVTIIFLCVHFIDTKTGKHMQKKIVKNYSHMCIYCKINRKYD